MNAVPLQAVPSNQVEIPYQPASLDIWDKKYRLKTKSGETIDRDLDGTYARVARALAEVETPEKQEFWFERFLWALQNGAIHLWLLAPESFSLKESAEAWADVLFDGLRAR